MAVDDGVPAATEPADALMSRGVFARRSGLSLKALRLYEQLDLLRPARVDAANSYRWYRESQVETARLIVLLRRLDMPLAQIADVVSAPPARGAEIIASYWDSVERRTAAQRELADHVRRRLSGETAAAARFDVREREVPEQLVLTEERRLGIDELESWVWAAEKRLVTSARQCGGVAGRLFRIFRGEVGEDSEEYVEVCVPVNPHGMPVDAAVRVEPAHREVYVTLNKAQFEYPQVLTGYRTLEQWICDNSLGWAGAPREVYLAGVDVETAAPLDAVCDVAYPVTDSRRS